MFLLLHLLVADLLVRGATAQIHHVLRLIEIIVVRSVLGSRVRHIVKFSNLWLFELLRAATLAHFFLFFLLLGLI